MFCNQCGQSVPEKSAFCPTCGNQLSQVLGLSEVPNKPSQQEGSLIPPESLKETDARPVVASRRSRFMVVGLAVAAVVVVGVLALVGSGGTLTNDLGMKFVKIPAGTFLMGTSGGDKDEQPAHSVTISRAFYMATTVVTQGQWEAVMGNNPSEFKGRDLPVDASWDDAKTFIARLNEREPGKGYRLPTEAEWEYACRAGSTGERYGDLDAIAWYDKNSGKSTHPVGQKQPNAWGLYDMNGNVGQWCEDWFGDYPSDSVTDPQGPSSGDVKVFRGGCWLLPANTSRSAFRGRNIPYHRMSIWGFRLLRTSP